METPPCWSISLSECTGGDSREKSFWQKKKPQLVNGGLSRIGSSHLRTGDPAVSCCSTRHPPTLIFLTVTAYAAPRFYLFTGCGDDVRPPRKGLRYSRAGSLWGAQDDFPHLCRNGLRPRYSRITYFEMVFVTRNSNEFFSI